MLCTKELPIFSNTANNIYHSLDDEKKGAMELASIILQDPNLTAKLLKIANSPIYNPSKLKISTVSRAIVVLGAKVIRELTLACAFFESILTTANKERANQKIAQAIHAAVQARELAILMQEGLPEEVFVAALLHNIGEIAFWCTPSKQATQINELLENNHLSLDEAEKMVLGFTLQDLSKQLSKAWHFGGLIDECISHPTASNTRNQIVLMGSAISLALKSGWDSPAMKECLAKLQKLTAQPSAEMLVKLKNHTMQAVKIARQFGALDASKFISKEGNVPMDDEVEVVKLDRKQIQFQMLQDITSHITGKIEPTLLLEMVLEGMHRGLEMDRSLFLLFNPEKHLLTEKISIDGTMESGAEKIQIHCHELEGNLLFHALSHKEGLWVRPQQYQNLYTAQLIKAIGMHECFLFPVYTEQKAVGLIYVDRNLSAIPFTESDFMTAKHFATQANIGLILYSMKKS